MSDILTQDLLFRGKAVTLQILGPETIGIQRGVVTSDLLAHLRAHKGEIIAEACNREFATWQSERPAPGGDPRPDMAQDSGQWARLLASAYELDGKDPAGTWAALHVVRCLGAEIRVRRGKWRLEAGLEYAGNWQGDRERYLAPRTATIKRLLAEMAEKPAPSAPESAEVLQKRAKVRESGELEAPTGEMLPLFGQGATV